MPATSQAPSLDVIAKRIKSARAKRRLSLRQLAAVTGVPFYTIQKAESGEEILGSSLVAICRTLKVRL